MQESGIRSSEDLLPLPWDKEHQGAANLPTENDVEELQALMRKMNEEAKSNENNSFSG